MSSYALAISRPVSRDVLPAPSVALRRVCPAGEPAAASPGLRWRFVLIQAGFAFLLSTLVRIILVNSFGPSPGIGWREGFALFAKGAHADLAVTLGIWCPLALWLAVVPGKWLDARWNRRLLQAASWVCWALLIF